MPPQPSRFPDADKQPRPGAPLLVIGWRSADWTSLHPLIDSGVMPHLRALIERGCAGPLAGPFPLLREALWTSLATGLLADRHGVAAATQPRADGGDVEPAGRAAWRAPAFWESLHAAGHPTACIGWPATAPADRWPGIHVDETYPTATGDSPDTWALPPHCIAPADRRETLRPLRLHPAEIAPEQIAALAPGAPPDSDGWRRAAGLLAQAASIHAAATDAVEQLCGAAAEADPAAPGAVICVVYEFLHHAKRLFGGPAAAPAGMDWPARRAVIERAHGLADLMLGRLVELAGADATILLVSPNGLRVAEDRPLEGHLRGVLVAAGPGIAEDRLLPGASVLDIAPSLLARSGLSADSDGRILPALAPHPTPPPTPTPIQADIPGEPAEPDDPAAALLAAGYRDQLGPAQRQALDDTAVTAAVNTAEARMARGDHAGAAEILRGLLALRPHHLRALQRLAQCLTALGDYDACRPIGETLLEIDPASPYGHLVLGAWCALTGNADEAASHLERAAALAGGRAGVFARLGGIELLRQRAPEAAARFEQALTLDPDHAEALYGLGVARQTQGDAAGAEDALRRGLRLDHHQPAAHLALARLLLARQRWREAAAALETALAQQPALPEAAGLLERARGAILAEAVAQKGRE